MCPREGPKVGQVRKKKPDNWPKEGKDPEELPHVNDLSASLLLVTGATHTLSLQCASLPCFCLNHFSVSSPAGAVSLIINFIPVFTVFTFLRNAFISRDKSQGELCSGHCLSLV